MAFGRRSLAGLDGHAAVIMAARALYPQGSTPDPQRFIVEASLFAEDGRADPRNTVSIDLRSWDELLPYIHSIHLRFEPSSSSPREGNRERDGDRYREDRHRDRERDREREPERTRGAERRDGRTHGGMFIEGDGEEGM